MSEAYSSNRQRRLFIAAVALIGLVSLVQPGCDCSSDGSFAPQVVATVFPVQNSDSALVGTDVVAFFGIDMDPATINDSTFTLTEAGGAQQAATVSYDTTTRSATLNPTTDLASGTQYRATISSTVQDAAGNTPLSSDFSWSFTVAESMRLVSTDASGVAANNTSQTADIDATGRFIVFESTATNLVTSTPTGGLNQVYRKDNLTGDVLLASSDDSGLIAADLDASNPRMSTNGRYVVFESRSTNLDALRRSNGVTQIYLKDMDTGRVQIASRDETGIPDNSANTAANARVSDDGRFVVFESADPDLSPIIDNLGNTQIYRKDMLDESVDMISRVNLTAGNGDSLNPDMSPDGIHVVFESSALNLGANGIVQQIFYVDATMTLPAPEIISTSTAGIDAGNDCFNPSVSDDGIVVVFEALDNGAGNNLDPLLDTNGNTDIYIRDRTTPTPSTVLVSVNSAGTDGANGDSTDPDISSDGSYVAFGSRANDIDGGNLGVRNIYVRDLSVTPIIDTRRLSITVTGASTTSPSVAPQISPDGRYVSFDSLERYTLDDTDSLNDVYRVHNSTFQ